MLESFTNEFNDGDPGRNCSAFNYYTQDAVSER